MNLPWFEVNYRRDHAACARASVYALHALPCARVTLCAAARWLARARDARVYASTCTGSLTRLHGSLADTWCSRFVARPCHDRPDREIGRERERERMCPTNWEKEQPERERERERKREKDGQKVKGLSRCQYTALQESGLLIVAAVCKHRPGSALSCTISLFPVADLRSGFFWLKNKMGLGG